MLPAATLLILVILGVATNRRSAPSHVVPTPPLGMPGAPSTSRADLERTVAAMEQRLSVNRGDAAAAVTLADAFLRQARLTGDVSLAVRADQALRRVLSEQPSDYEARRMLGTVLLSQHRFTEAIAEAARTKAVRPDDAWNDGVVGDAYLELGDYAEAFDAFDRMMARRPTAAAYARASYARELQGDLAAALLFMNMALEATSAADPEAQAWHEAQIGHLELELGHPPKARQHFERAEFVFPRHPMAADGLVRALRAEGRDEEAFEVASREFAVLPSAAIAAQLGELSLKLGRAVDAERYFAEAERLWRYEPVALARFLADHNRRISSAVELATAAARTRRDIFTDDALAWALYRAGRLPEALDAARRAMRTGTRDRSITAHAIQIFAAAGDLAAARTFTVRADAVHR